MGYFSDSDSEDFSVCSNEGSEHMAPKSAAPSARSFSANLTRSVREGTNEDRLDAIMQLRAEMGMNQDPEFLKKEAEKAAIKKKKEEEKAKLAAMSLEDRVEHQKGSVSDMMSRIRRKREQSLRQSSLMKEAQLDGSPVPEETAKGEDDNMAAFRKLKLSKAKSKRKLLKTKSAKKVSAATTAA